MNLGWYGNGHLDDDYVGLDGGSSIRLPLIHELCKQDHSVSWLGTEKKTSTMNHFHDLLGLKKEVFSVRQLVSDTIDLCDYDAMLFESRPYYHVKEFEEQNRLIADCIKSGVVPLLWDQDLWAYKLPTELRDNVILLRPYFKMNSAYKHQEEFHYFWHDFKRNLAVEQLFDFVYVGNEYRRRRKFADFFGELWPDFKTLVTGNWMRKKYGCRDFALQYSHIIYSGANEHCFTIPFLSAGKATIQIVPKDYIEYGLMTARIFESLMAGQISFADEEINGITNFIPTDLCCKNGDEVSQFYSGLDEQSMKNYKEEFFALTEDESVSNRAIQLQEIVDKYG